jgi:hypothetical protein
LVVIAVSRRVMKFFLVIIINIHRVNGLILL